MQSDLCQEAETSHTHKLIYIEIDYVLKKLWFVVTTVVIDRRSDPINGGYF